MPDNPGKQSSDEVDENQIQQVNTAGDGRFVPYFTVGARLERDGCTVEARLVRDGETVGPFEVPFVWPPGAHHYGRNVEVPGSGSYDLHVRIESPEFHRHDERNGDRYGGTVEVTFEGVDVEAGRG